MRKRRYKEDLEKLHHSAGPLAILYSLNIVITSTIMLFPLLLCLFNYVNIPVHYHVHSA